MFDTTLH